MSTPLMLAGLLVGGLVPKPWLETGDRIGEGDLFRADGGRDVKPVRCRLSREVGLFNPTLCSDCTTSANEINDSRRTSADSREP